LAVGVTSFFDALSFISTMRWRHTIVLRTQTPHQHSLEVNEQTAGDPTNRSGNPSYHGEAQDRQRKYQEEIRRRYEYHWET
jgi:hypothetical protein